MDDVAGDDVLGRWMGVDDGDDDDADENVQKNNRRRISKDITNLTLPQSTPPN